MTPQQMLRALMADDAGETAPVRPALMDVALRDEADFYTRENPFRLGDLVTPRKGTSIKGVGDAHIVIAVRDALTVDFSFVGEPGSTAYGKRMDIRVLCWMGGRYAAYWVESAEFEAWVQAEAETAAVDTAAAA